MEDKRKGKGEDKCKGKEEGNFEVEGKPEGEEDYSLRPPGTMRHWPFQPKIEFVLMTPPLA